MKYTIILPAMIAFAISAVLCPVIIPFLHKLKFGQFIRDEGPESHQKKSGTPTMGGVIFIVSVILTSLFYMKDYPSIIPVAFATLGFGIIGFMDDYIKVVKKRSLGLRAWQKLALQLIVTAVFCWYVMMKSGIGTAIYIPFTNGMELDLGILFVPFLFIAVLGTVNGVNLTDGLDGLAGGVTLIVAAFFMIVSWAAGSMISPVCGAIVGALLAFLLFNCYPAKVFMGDTGSLALGGFVAATAFVLKMPIFIVIVGFVYLWESITVMLQVGWFKITKRKYGEGRRLFKMAPFHHHLEQCGWRETKVVTLFYVVTALLCLLGFLGSKAMF